MSAAPLPLALDQGADFYFDFTVDINGVRRPLYDHFVRSEARVTRDSPDVAFTFDAVVTDAENGNVRISLTNAVTSIIPAGTYYYDVKIYTAGDATVTKDLTGIVTVLQGVTD